MIRLRKAQNIGEYAIVLAVVSAALIAMQSYLQRSVQGLVKLSFDEIGNQSDTADESFNFFRSSVTLNYTANTTDLDITITQDEPNNGTRAISDFIRTNTTGENVMFEGSSPMM